MDEQDPCLRFNSRRWNFVVAGSRPYSSRTSPGIPNIDSHSRSPIVGKGLAISPMVFVSIVYFCRHRTALPLGAQCSFAPKSHNSGCTSCRFHMDGAFMDCRLLPVSPGWRQTGQDLRSDGDADNFGDLAELGRPWNASRSRDQPESAIGSETSPAERESENIALSSCVMSSSS